MIIVYNEFVGKRDWGVSLIVLIIRWPSALSDCVLIMTKMWLTTKINNLSLQKINGMLRVRRQNG